MLKKIQGTKPLNHQPFKEKLMSNEGVYSDANFQFSGVAAK